MESYNFDIRCDETPQSIWSKQLFGAMFSYNTLDNGLAAAYSQNVTVIS